MKPVFPFTPAIFEPCFGFLEIQEEFLSIGLPDVLHIKGTFVDVIMFELGGVFAVTIHPRCSNQQRTFDPFSVIHGSINKVEILSRKVNGKSQSSCKHCGNPRLIVEVPTAALFPRLIWRDADGLGSSQPTPMIRRRENLLAVLQKNGPSIDERDTEFPL